MQDCHIMLGSPWQFNRNDIHYRRKNKTHLDQNKINYKLATLTPSQVCEVQKHMAELMKNFEREKKRALRECMLTF